ncbi:MAG: archaeosortase/exosortase family protein [Sphingomicrobium sp.]
MSIITWVAIAAALSLLAEHAGADSGSPRHNDWVATAFAFVAAVVPTSTASAAALSIIAIYLYLTSPARSGLQRAAPIILSVTVAVMWGRIALAMFSKTMLRIDAVLVGLLGIRTSENQVFFAVDPGPTMAPHFLIAPGCSSLHSISMAVVFCTVVHGWFGIRATLKSLLVCLAAVVAVVAINVLRLGAFSYFPAYFDEIHKGWIASLIAWVTVAVIVTIVSFGMKREILRQD